MSKVTVNEKVIKPEQVIPAVTETTITLEMTEDEALYVTAMLGVGNPYYITGNLRFESPFCKLHNALGLRLFGSTQTDRWKKYYALSKTAKKFLEGTRVVPTDPIL